MIESGLELLDALHYLRYLRRRKAETLCPARRRDLDDEIAAVRDEIDARTGRAWSEAEATRFLTAYRSLVGSGGLAGGPACG